MKLTERLAVLREQFGHGPVAHSNDTEPTCQCACCGRCPKGGCPARCKQRDKSARSAEGGLRCTEATCRTLWEVPAWESLLLQADCVAQSGKGAGREPGRLFVFEDAWVFAPDQRAEPQRRRGRPPDNSLDQSK